MILPDSSVWIDHLRHGEPRLVECLTNAEVLFHPFVVGEIALQLRGQAGDRQVSGARVGLAQMLGGVASGLETGAASVQVLSL